MHGPSELSSTANRSISQSSPSKYDLGIVCTISVVTVTSNLVPPYGNSVEVLERNVLN